MKRVPTDSAMPMIMPPTRAPSAFPIPPRHTMQNAVTMNRSPMSLDTGNKGEMIAPATPAQAEPMANVTM
jgi:hypothetical protein